MATPKVVSAIFESHSKSIASRIARAREERDTVASWKKSITPLLKLLAFDDTKDSNISVEAGWGGVGLSIRMYMYDAESFKSDLVMSRLWVLENWEGLVKQDTTDFPAALNRTFFYRYADGLRVHFDVYVKADSPTCRKVVIGEETKTVQTYAIQCD
jgi:hypothetical protein